MNKLFNSEFKPIKFINKIKVFYKETYGYVPIVFVYIKAKNLKTEIPRFAISQHYFDKHNQWHNYFDKFILHVEKYNKKDFVFYYYVMNWKKEIQEQGEIKNARN